MCTQGFTYSKPFTAQCGQTIFPPLNQTLNGDGFYISYNNTDTHLYGSDTTALVDDNMACFLILNGDHRAEYALLAKKGYAACINYFMSHLNLKARFSAMPPAGDNQ